MSDMQEWKDIEDMIKRVAEKESLPDSLAPEAIEEKLRAALAEEEKREDGNSVGDSTSGEKNAYKADGKSRNWKRKVPRWGTLVAACFALLVVLSVVLVQNDIFSGKSKYAKNSEGKQTEASEEMAQAEKEVLEEVLVGASSEEEIFEQIDRIQNPDKYKTVGERIIDGFVGLLNVVNGNNKDVAAEEIMMDSVESESAMNYGASSDSMDSTGSTNGAYAGASEENKQMESVEDTGREYSGTNLQEQGVDEADVVKTDGKYFYIKRANQNEIAIVEVDGEQMNTVSRIALPDSSEEEEQYLHEFYVLGDKLALMKTVNYYETPTSRHFNSSRSETHIEIYDITDRQTPNLISELSQDGAYDSSRMNGGYLYTFSDHYIFYAIQEDKPETYMPCAEGEVIACEDIYLPEQADSTHYKVITSINLDAPESIHFQTEKAVLCGSGLSYVSTNAIYFLAGSYVNQIEDNYNTSEIWKFSYQDGNIIGSASGMVKGDIRDQFAMSEANGYLRVVTTYYKTEPRSNLYGFTLGRSASSSMAMTDDVAWVSNEDMKNGLYILDGNLNVVGSLEDLAPGEQIYSARFFTDTAYFVTFRQTDPLFSVDVSDPTNPVLLGELKIPGFSEYLHPYGEGRLLGIGYAADDNGRQTGIKLSMFDVSDPSNVKEIATEMIAKRDNNTDYYSPSLYNHKAVLVDVGKNLIGCNIEGFIYTGRSETRTNAYVVYGYEDGQGFFQKHKTELAVLQSYGNQYDESYEKEMAKCSEIRGAYIDNYFYTINEGYTIQCFDMEDNFALKSEYEY